MLQTAADSSAVPLESQNAAESGRGAVFTIVLSIKIASCYCGSLPTQPFRPHWSDLITHSIPPQRPHQNITTTQAQIPCERVIQTVNTQLPHWLAFASQHTEIKLYLLGYTCNGDFHHHSYQNHSVFMS